ncbi:MAG: DUF4153 domain-containing protein [Bacteroidota bacterium]|jgi:hypothetical protein
MKLPSFDYVIGSAVKTFLRFPITMLFAFLGTINVILSIENMGDETVRMKLILCAALGLTSSLALSLWASYYRLSKVWNVLSNLVLVTLLTLYYFSLGDSIKEIDGIRYFVLNVSLHLLVSFVLFIKNKEVDEFWSFNKNLFIRIITSGIYSVTLIIGLNFAVLAIDNLFGIDVDERIYPEIIIVILGIFNTLFFLSGVPRNEELNLPLAYPKGLRAFTQFVLIPLVLIYLIILWAYETKILFTATLPKGWVSILILVFSVLGILAMLLVYPLRNNEDHTWIKKLWKWYFRLIIPLIGLLYWAILYRINLYGFTVERYYVLLLALWLTAITVYSIIKPNYHIKIIPISLAIVGFISLYGPQSAANVSKVSQQNRLVELLQIHHSKGLSEEEESEISSAVTYLFNNYSAKVLVPYFPKAFPTDSSYEMVSVASILQSENLEVSLRSYLKDEDQRTYFDAEVNEQLFTVPASDGFWCGNINNRNTLTVKGKGINEVVLKLENNMLEVKIEEEEIQLSLMPFVQLAGQRLNSYRQEHFTVIKSGTQYQVTLMVKNLNGYLAQPLSKSQVNSFYGLLFIKKK